MGFWQEMASSACSNGLTVGDLGALLLGMLCLGFGLGGAYQLYRSARDDRSRSLQGGGG